MDTGKQKKVFDGWLREHRGLLFKVLRAYAFSPQDQDDLFQEMALQLWNSVPSFRGKSSEATWIYRVALYAAIAWTRREAKHRASKRNLDAAPLLRVEEGAKDPRVAWLYEQIAGMNEIDRSLTLLLLDGYAYKEMAEMLGISESNVGVKINRIKKRLMSKSVEH